MSASRAFWPVFRPILQTSYQRMIAPTVAERYFSDYAYSEEGTKSRDCR